MTRAERILGGILVLVCLLLVGYLGVLQYGAARHAAGYADAVADGKSARDSAAASALAIESGLRTQLLARDSDALRKELEHASNLEAAQRRVRAGVDSLRCPAGPVPTSTASSDRPAAGGSTPDEPGPAIVPEIAAEILGDGAAIAGLVRRYGRLEQRFDECQALTKAP